MPTHWDIRREGRVWQGEEVRARWALTPEKLELIEGRLFWTYEERLTMLGLLLERIGADAAVHLGDPIIWKEAVKALPY